MRVRAGLDLLLARYPTATVVLVDDHASPSWCDVRLRHPPTDRQTQWCIAKQTGNVHEADERSIPLSDHPTITVTPLG